MSIESDLSSIAKSLEVIANFVTNQPTKNAKKTEVVPAPVVAPVVAPVATPVVATPEPVAAVAAPVPAPAPAVEVQDVPAPAPAVVAAPAPAPVAATGTMTKDDFTKRLLAKYQALGPVNGTKIQDILAAHGCQAVNSVPVDKYLTIIEQVEALV